MAEYQAPLREMAFAINEVNDFDAFASECGFNELNSELADAILQEAAKFASGVVSPLNRVGDKQPARWQDGQVITPPGWKDAYQQFCEGGWNGLSLPEAYGGQGMPNLIAASVMEMLNSANMSFALGSLLTSGAVHALLVCASDALKDRYLPNMVSGRWAGTMNLTEPQAGSDLAAVRSKAVPQADGSYRISGQKIFITYGEHDLTENIIHLVLARLPDAPPGVKGISLFLVPKFMVGDDGSLGQANDVRCVSIEHKLGIHGSPTCVLSFGDNGGATGYLLGEANRGLEYMFVMMNDARFGVGMQGIAMGERAYQQARDYAAERIQGRDLTGSAGGVAIMHHPDVARLLRLIEVQVTAGRLMATHTAALLDRAQNLTGEAATAALYKAELLIPVVKAWNTEKGIENTSHALQVHGGMGYIEETGAAQYYRDVRITTIYEGTTAIQANDLLGRKLARDAGATLKNLGAEVQSLILKLATSEDPILQGFAPDLGKVLGLLAETVEKLLTNLRSSTKSCFGGSVPLLMGMGDLCGGWMMAKAALVAHQRKSSNPADAAFYQRQILLAAFYFRHVLPQAHAHLRTARDGGDSLVALMS